jgi:predicted ester cyclase
VPTADVAELVTRFYETVHNDHDLTILDVAFDPGVVAHWSGLPELHGPAELRAAVTADLGGFPDQAMTLDEIVVEGDVAASRWTFRGTHTGEYYGIPATGRAIVSTVVAFDRIRDGKLVENWTVFDNYDVMRQLGIVPDDEVVA